MKLNEFLSKHTVFTVNELDKFLSTQGTGNSNTRKSLLSYYRKQKRIIPIRRGLYATIPPGENPNIPPIDPYLIAAKITEDAVLAYHTAIEFHGKAYSIYSTLYYISSHKSLPLTFQNHKFVRIAVPHPLKTKGKEMFGVNIHKHSGVELKVTNLERTAVDMLDRLELTGSLEEIWRSLESVEFFNIDQIIEYTLLLENSTTTAKVGFFLQQHKEILMVENYHLKQLKKMRPKQPHYFMRSKRKGCKWIKEWNLLVPQELLNKSWEEML